MAISNIICDSCGKEYLWQQQLAGHTVRCTCGQTIAVPQAEIQTDSVYALAPSEESKPQSRAARNNLDDSLFQLPCPACSRPIEFGGTVCTGCGYNVKTGEYTAPRAPTPAEYVRAESVATATSQPAPPPVTLPRYAAPVSTPKHVEEETRKSVLIRYLAMMGVVLLLVAIVFSVKSFKSTPAAGTESLSPDDVAVYEKLQSEGTLEAKVWLEKDEQRLLGRYNQKQAQAKIDEMYRAGAAKVSILPGRFVMSVVVELPTKPDLRKRFFDWQQEHHGAIGETVTFDTGQKYIYVTMPR